MEEMTLEQLASLSSSYAARAKAWTEIANLFTRHVYYIRSGFFTKDLAELWSAREDISWMVDGSGYIGRESVQACYADAKVKVQHEVLSVLSGLVPDHVEDQDENLGAGEYEMHALINPFIQVAKDCGTAKGVWYSPGIVGHVEADGEYHAYACALILAADFICEDGAWKIWHLREDDEAAFDLDGNSLDRSLAQAKAGQEAGNGMPPFMMFPSKEEIEKMLAEGRIPGGRTGETLRTLYDLPPASPKSNLYMTDRPRTSVLHPNRFIDDMVLPYDTWDESMSVIRNY